MAAQHVHTHDLHHHAAAQADPRARGLAREREAHVVEVPPLVAQGRHADEPLGTRCIEADEGAQVGDPRDDAHVALADATGVQLRHLDLLRCGRGSVGRTLLIARLLAELRKDRLERLRAPAREARRPGGRLPLAELPFGKRQLEDAVYDKIGVSANGAGEVAVRPGAEGVMALVAGLVHGTLLGTQQQRVDLGGERGPRSILDRRVDGARIAEHDARGQAPFDRAELGEGLRRRSQAVGRGLLVNAICASEAAVGEEFGHALVGEQHGLLDQARRRGALARDDIDGHAGIIQEHMDLRRIEIDGAALAADLAAGAGERIGVAQERDQVHTVGARRLDGLIRTFPSGGVDIALIRRSCLQQRIRRAVIHAHA